MSGVPYALIACALALLSLLIALTAAIRPFRDRKHRFLLSRVEGCEIELAEMVALLKRIDARDRMRAIRSGNTTEADSTSPTKAKSRDRPDPHSQPNEWKAWMRENRPAIGVHKTIREQDE